MYILTLLCVCIHNLYPVYVYILPHLIVRLCACTHNLETVYYETVLYYVLHFPPKKHKTKQQQQNHSYIETLKANKT